MLTIRDAVFTANVDETVDGSIVHPVNYYLEVTDQAGNEYLVSTNEATFNGVSKLMNEIEENQSYVS